VDCGASNLIETCRGNTRIVLCFDMVNNSFVQVKMYVCCALVILSLTFASALELIFFLALNHMG
jgi:hypothetical protein